MGQPHGQMGRLVSLLWTDVLEAKSLLQALYRKTTANSMDVNSTLAA